MLSKLASESLVSVADLLVILKLGPISAQKERLVFLYRNHKHPEIFLSNPLLGDILSRRVAVASASMRRVAAASALMLMLSKLASESVPMADLLVILKFSELMLMLSEATQRVSKGPLGLLFRSPFHIYEVCLLSVLMADPSAISLVTTDWISEELLMVVFESRLKRGVYLVSDEGYLQFDNLQFSHFWGPFLKEEEFRVVD